MSVFRQRFRMALRMTGNRSKIGKTPLRWLKRAVTAAVFTIAVFLVIREAARIEWTNVVDALRNCGFASLALAFVLGVPGQLACACFDLIGRHATGHKLPILRVMLISFTGYYCSLNLGALVGGLAFRYRLYARYRFSPTKIGQIIGLSVLTNWSGYVLIAGIVLTYQPPDLPTGWGPGTGVLRGIGLLLLILTAAYVALCAVRGGTTARWRDSELRIPTLGVAAVQYALSMTSWAVIGMVIAWLLPGDISWLTVMPIVMLSAIAGIWSHVPGGLGVTEFVFLTMLSGRIDDSELLAGLLAFRAVYYLLPFVLAIAAFAYLEATAGNVPMHASDAES
jgi:uncharacterized membrane protein YbhN (UPF0104 family)